MPGLETVRLSKCSLPARRPTIGTAIPGGCVQTQSRDDRKSMTVARVNRDPSSSAAASETAEVAGTHRRPDQSRRGKGIRDGAGTIVTRIDKGTVTTAVTIGFGTKLIRGPDCSLHWQGGVGWSAGQTEAKLSCASRNNWSGRRKRTGQNG